MTNQCRLNLSENELQKIQECLQEIISLVKNIAEIIKNVISPVFLKRLDSKSFHFAKHNKNKRIRKSTRKKLYKLILALFRPGELSFSCPNYWRCVI